MDNGVQGGVDWLILEGKKKEEETKQYDFPVEAFDVSLEIHTYCDCDMPEGKTMENNRQYLTLGYHPSLPLE